MKEDFLGTIIFFYLEFCLKLQLVLNPDQFFFNKIRIKGTGTCCNNFILSIEHGRENAYELMIRFLDESLNVICSYIFR